LFLVVLSAGIGCVGVVFAVEIKVGDNFTVTFNIPTPEVQAQAKPSVVAADVPRELAMRPLPAYRIEPPDIIQIEVTAKGKQGSGSQSSSQSSPSSNQSDHGAASGGTITSTIRGGSLTKTVADALSGSASGNNPGTVTITADTVPSTDTNVVTASGGNNNTGSATINAGTLTVSGANTYTGTTTVTDGSLSKTGGGTLTFSKAGDTTNPAGEPLNFVSTGMVTVTGNGVNVGDTKSGGTLTISGNISDAKSGDTILFQRNPNTGAVWSSVADGRVAATEPIVARNLVRNESKSSAAHLASGQYLVGPDGTINMHKYGTLQVTGMTIAEVKAAVEKHLAQYFDSPEVWVDVLGYNSKVFYIITDGAGMGDNVRRIPMTGNETVLDAVAAIGGLSQFSSKKMWIARPSATDSQTGTILPVDYAGITQRGATATNYQIMAGDRIFIAEDRLIGLNNNLSKMTAPVERIMGLISLGAATIEGVERLLPQQGNK
jgi:autotransporter-associated beta strand protein